MNITHPIIINNRRYTITLLLYDNSNISNFSIASLSNNKIKSIYYTIDGHMHITYDVIAHKYKFILDENWHCREKYNKYRIKKIIYTRITSKLRKEIV